jgi:hypothetical protein
MATTPWADYFGDGKFAAGVASAATIADLQGADPCSDAAETFFAMKKMHMQHNPGIAHSSAGGLATASFNRTFDPSLFVQQQEGAGTPTSVFGELPPSCQTSVILTAQKEANPYTRGTRNEIASYIGSQKGKLATKAAESLMSAVRTNEEAVRFFPLPRWTTSAQVDSELKKLGGDEAAKKEALKDQGKIRWKGFGWADLRFAFSAAGVEHTVEDLTAKVKSMIKCEAGRVPPSEPPTFVPRTQLLFHLGTLTPGALALRDEAAWSTGEIEDARVKFRSERAHAAAKREHERHDAYAVEQPEQPPTIAAGLKIEVLTQLVHEGGHTFNQWLPATVMELPTEDKKKTSADGKKRTVPKDFYFLAYDDGLSAWTKLTEGNFNCARKGSWRLDLDEPENRASGGGEGGAGGVGGGMEGDENSDSEEESDTNSAYSEGELDGDSGDDEG